MRVVFATEIFSPWQRGGAEVSILELANGLAKCGAKVVIVTPKLGEDKNCPELPKGVEVVRFELPIFKPRGADTPFYAFNHPLFFARFARAIIQHAIAFQAQIIHAHNYYSYIPSLKAARALGLKAVATARDYRLICPIAWCITKDYFPARCGIFKFYSCLREFWNLHERGALEAWPKFFSRHLYERAFLLSHRKAFLNMDAAHFISHGQKQIYEKFGLAHPSAFVQHNPVDPSKLESESAETDELRRRYGLEDKKVLLFVGRFSIGKGARLALDAFGKLVEKRANIAFVVIGSNGLGSEVERFKDRGLLMIGRVEKGELWKWYLASDVIVVPPIWPEPFGRVVAEAQALGRLVVASDIGGLREQIQDGVNGLLIPVGNSDALASAILKIFDEPSLAARLSSEARNVAQLRTPENVAGRFMDWYRSVLERD